MRYCIFAWKIYNNLKPCASERRGILLKNFGSLKKLTISALSYSKKRGEF